jgi:hypothetical protein
MHVENWSSDYIIAVFGSETRVATCHKAIQGDRTIVLWQVPQAEESRKVASARKLRSNHFAVGHG